MNRIVMYFLVLFLFSHWAFAQEKSDCLEKLFGNSFRNPCVVGKDSGAERYCTNYNFNEDYMVGVGSDENRKILKVYLFPKAYAEEMDRSISSEDKRDFLEKAGQLRSFGSLRFSGKSSLPWALNADIWEIYENAYIAYSFKTFADGSRGLAAILVYFPFEIKGQVSKIESFELGSNGNKLLKVFLDGQTYLTVDRLMKEGFVAGLTVINP